MTVIPEFSSCLCFTINESQKNKSRDNEMPQLSPKKKIKYPWQGEVRCHHENVYYFQCIHPVEMT